MDISIYFNNQCRFMTVKVNDKPRDNLLPPKMDTQLIRPQFMPYAARSFQQESCHAEVLSHVGVFLLSLADQG